MQIFCFMKLPNDGNEVRSTPTMIRKLVVRAVFSAVLLGVFAGCTATTNYSLRSYQGPLPLEDYRFVNVHTYGAPVTGR
jgi:hypothetical protein